MSRRCVSGEVIAENGVPTAARHAAADLSVGRQPAPRLGRMSVKVDLDRLAGAAGRFCALRLSDHGRRRLPRTHRWRSSRVLADGVIDVGPDRQQHAQRTPPATTASRLSGRRANAGGYSLIVDGQGRARLTPTALKSRSAEPRRRVASQGSAGSGGETRPRQGRRCGRSRPAEFPAASLRSGGEHVFVVFMIVLKRV